MLYSIENIINDKVIGIPYRWLSQYIHIWVQPLLVAGVLLFSLVYGFGGVSEQMALPALALLGSIGAIWFVLGRLPIDTLYQRLPIINLFSGKQDHFLRWLRVRVISAILLLSLILPFMASETHMLLIIAGGVGFSALLIALVRWPLQNFSFNSIKKIPWLSLGGIALIFTIVIQWSGPSHSNLTMVVAAGLLGLWLLNMMKNRRLQIVSSPPTLPLLLLVLISTFAFGFGQLPWYTFIDPAPLGSQLGSLALVVLSAGIFLVMAHVIRDIRWLKWTTWVFLSISSLLVVSEFVPAVSSIMQPYSSKHTTGSLFWLWVVVLSLGQAVFNSKLSLFWRGLLGGLGLATLYAVVFPRWAWNSGWMPALAGLTVMICVARPKLGLLVGIAGGVGVIFKFEAIYNKIMVGDNEYSLATRLDAWKIVWDMADINPWLGLGPANYYYYSPLFPIRGYAVQFNSHQQYMDLIAQSGVLGLLCFIWFFGTVGWVGWQLRNRVPPGFAQAYVYAAIGGVAGTLISGGLGDWVIPFFYNITLGGFRASMLSWLFLGGLIAIQQIYSFPKQ